MYIIFDFNKMTNNMNIDIVENKSTLVYYYEIS